MKVLAWYGDDFTGSTDVMEMLSLHGLPAVLFLERPDARLLARFCRVPGLWARGQQP